MRMCPRGKKILARDKMLLLLLLLLLLALLHRERERDSYQFLKIAMGKQLKFVRKAESVCCESQIRQLRAD